MHKIVYCSTLTLALVCASAALSPSNANTIRCTANCGPGGQYQVPSWSFDVDPGITLDAVYYLWNPIKVPAVVETLPGLSTTTRVGTGHLASGGDAGSGLAHIYELSFSAGENPRYKNKDIVFVFSAMTTLTDVTMEGLRHFQSFDFEGSPSDGSILTDEFLSGPPSPTFGTLDTTATPLPATLPLFAGGLGAIGLLGWRRKKKPATVAA